MYVKKHYVLKLFARSNDQHNQMLKQIQAKRHMFHDCFSEQNHLHLSIIQVHSATSLPFTAYCIGPNKSERTHLMRLAQTLLMIL